MNFITKKKIALFTILTILLISISTALANTYVGSNQSNKFHYPDCRAAKKITALHKINFSSREEALNRGYVPCGICRP